MKGDFARVSFDPRNHYSQVLLQQGRVTLDADPNEQGAILLHILRTMARDLFGPYGAPVDNAGFGLSIDAGDTPASLLLAPGRCYVDGILCETDGCGYLGQPHYIPPAASNDAPGDPLREWLESPDGQNKFWVYLDVWERHVTAIEHPWLREVALGGPDTCSRAQVIWQVKSLAEAEIKGRLRKRLDTVEQRLKEHPDDADLQRLQARLTTALATMDKPDADAHELCPVPPLALERDHLPELAAHLDPGQRLDDPCVMSPESGYRGSENHLYRVEVHRGSTAGAQATFKWSRDNGSVLTTWTAATGTNVGVGNTRGFQPGQWVELSHDEDDLLGRPGALYKVLGIEDDHLIVDGTPAWTGMPGAKARRWDQIERGDVRLVEGAVPVPEASAGDPAWIDLEDGIQIRFAPGREYRSGDYWMFAARVDTGKLEWPADAAGEALLQFPRGIEHHYASLGFVARSDSGKSIDVSSCGCLVYPPSTCGILADTGTRVVPPVRQPPIRDTKVTEIVAKPPRPVSPARKSAAGKTVTKRKPNS